MTKSLKWRLSKLPTSEEVTKLVNDKIITKEEAREILFNEVEEEEQTLEDAKKEIKFLKELVEKLGTRTQIIENIRYIQEPYYKYTWITPYVTWCGGNSIGTYTSGGTSTMYLTGNASYISSRDGNSLTGGSGIGQTTTSASSIQDVTFSQIG